VKFKTNVNVGKHNMSDNIADTRIPGSTLFLEAGLLLLAAFTMAILRAAARADCTVRCGSGPLSAVGDVYTMYELEAERCLIFLICSTAAFGSSVGRCFGGKGLPYLAVLKWGPTCKTSTTI
jgi:hypothetical protein